MKNNKQIRVVAPDGSMCIAGFSGNSPLPHVLVLAPGEPGPFRDVDHISQNDFVWQWKPSPICIDDYIDHD